MRKYFSVKSVPVAAWSSPVPLNFRPRLFTLFMLSFGLIVFGIGEGMLVRAGLGVSPWTVFAQGVSLQLGISIGWSTFAVSLLVLLLWIPLKQVPGLGTLLNAILIATALDVSLVYLPLPSGLVGQLAFTIGGILAVGFGSGLYLIANLGAGPRDGLMTGLQRRTDFPIAYVRLGIELCVVILGWLLGGSVGVGTLLFALGIGPAVALGLYAVGAASGATGVRYPRAGQPAPLQTEQATELVDGE